MKSDKYMKVLREIISKKLDGKNQSWLVREANIDKDRLSRFLNGGPGLTLGEIVGAARAFGVSPSELLDPVFSGEEISGASVDFKKARLKAKTKVSVEDFERKVSKTARPLEAKDPPALDDVFSFLSHYRELLPERKAVVAMYVYDDESYLLKYPELAPAVEAFLAASKIKK